MKLEIDVASVTLSGPCSCRWIKHALADPARAFLAEYDLADGPCALRDGHSVSLSCTNHGLAICFHTAAEQNIFCLPSRLLTAVILREFVAYLQSSSSGAPVTPEWSGWLLAFALGVASVAQACLQHQNAW